ncbi:O-antigen ligase family protein [Candidatus Solirubrobacter pratensis]|uniref:O-antigen ligase family protein n=1 Tax=Candidatus Solirubrobacter pratensis TaxID=1298857 RepID=UPI0003FE793D|nr:O-antigen ligase family protein [Candidatus Solirubrobacter pratensis]
MRRRVSAVAAGGLLLLPVVLAFSRGGYFDAARIRAAIAACVLAAVAAALAPLPRSGRVAIGGMAALTAWTALSLTWAPMGGPALDDLERLVLYLAALVAAALLLRTRWTEPALLAGITAAAAYGVSERLLPGLVHLTRSAAAGDRLSQPLTYWNAQGALAAVGLVLAAGLVARGPERGVRAAAAATAPLLGLDLYLTLSRGALGAFAAGLLVLLALRPTRVSLHGVMLVLVAAALPAIAAETALHPVLHADSSAGDGAGMLALLAVLALGAARIAAPPADDPFPRMRPLAAAALVAALAITVVAAAHGGRAAVPQGASRLASVESNRYAYWRAGLGTFADHPLKGVGSGGYRVEWLQRRDFAETVRDAHSLYVETAAELGIVGLLALAALFGGVAAAVRHEAVAGAALAAWAVHAGVDWDWEMPALTLVAVLLAGAAISRRA